MRSIRLTWIAGLLAIGTLLVAGLYYARDSRTPADQPPLVQITGQAVSALQAEFNRAAAGVRVIVLLSPT